MMSMSQHATLQDYLNATYGATKTEDKPTVEYAAIDSLKYIAVGERASVIAFDHYRLGTQRVSTSTVLNVDKRTGVFETRNTIYVPVQPEC